MAVEVSPLTAPAREPSFDILGTLNRPWTLVRHRLVDGEYRPVMVAAAGGSFAMIEPFEFSVDPAALLAGEG
jgi:hypothetical protein